MEEEAHLQSPRLAGNPESRKPPLPGGLVRDRGFSQCPRQTRQALAASAKRGPILSRIQLLRYRRRSPVPRYCARRVQRQRHAEQNTTTIFTREKQRAGVAAAQA